ncbi:MAG: ZIP family metal transporter [Hymenobacteraceae bacterium]|nr:ZIP family metal transporter [Hymenobacteraceae bacterium]MDX5396434.1 ZIP family metal transporter [Hymenobacteraceae bacterium]MDX5442359.1 ZIP family metal transporter [Hymenobacteraceae bacterium]MDX5512495.1 ZIP family metal transporter [Hymenobacteraceae bacterium]
MIIAALVLFFTVVATGFLVRFMPATDNRWLKIALAFSGAYLFTITIIHLLPDVLVSNPNPHQVGYWILAGFFLQLILEIFSHGIEHGHIHAPGSNHSDEHTHTIPYLLLGSLFIHSFLEGTILIEGGVHHGHHQHATENFYSILAGIAIHHIPAAFVLMSVLVSRLHSFSKAFAWLLLFAVGSPLGILLSNTLLAERATGDAVYTALTGLVAGNFLHISTTILFETSPEHRFNRNKIIATLVGLVLALLSDFI